MRKLEKENKKLKNENLLLGKLGREEKKENMEIVNGKEIKRDLKCLEFELRKFNEIYKAFHVKINMFQIDC